MQSLAFSTLSHGAGRKPEHPKTRGIKLLYNINRGITRRRRPGQGPEGVADPVPASRILPVAALPPVTAAPPRSPLFPPSRILAQLSFLEIDTPTSRDFRTSVPQVHVALTARLGARRRAPCAQTLGRNSALSVPDRAECFLTFVIPRSVGEPDGSSSLFQKNGLFPATRVAPTW